MRLLRIFFFLSLALLAACGDKRVVLKPSPLADISPVVKVKKAWAAESGKGSLVAGSRLVPAVTGAVVYTADSAGLVIARERTRGRVLWKRKTRAPISAGPVAAYNQLFMGTHEGGLMALSVDDGRMLWQAELGGEVLAPPAVEGDAVAVRSTDGRTTLLDRATGEIRWTYDGGSPSLALRAASRPVLLADIVLTGLVSGVLVALDRATGQVVWERRIAEPTGKSELDRLVDIAGDFVLVGDRLYAATYQGSIAALDLRTGQFVWQQPLSTLRSLAAGDGNIYAVDADSRIVAYRGADGVILWQLDALLHRQVTGIAVQGEWLLAGDFDGYLHVIRMADGVIVGRRRIDRDAIVTTPVIDDGQVFVLASSGKLAVLRVK